MKRLLVLLLLLSGCTTGKDAAQIGAGDFSPRRARWAGRSSGTRPTSARSSRGSKASPCSKQGKTVKLSDYAGKPVVINIWGAWCGPCRTEAPEMQKIFDAGTQVLGVDVKETSTEHPAGLHEGPVKLTYPSIYDASGRSFINVFRGVPANTVPSTFIVDKNHKVAAVVPGAGPRLRPPVRPGRAGRGVRQRVVPPRPPFVDVALAHCSAGGCHRGRFSDGILALKALTIASRPIELNCLPSVRMIELPVGR